MMHKKCVSWSLILLFCIGSSLAENAVTQSDVADVPSKSLFAGGDKNKRYFLIGADERIEAPEKGFALLIVLPGGHGGPDRNPFVRRIYKRALSKKYLVAQLVAVKWTPSQYTVWPTKRDKVAGQRFSTEEFAEAAVKDIKAKCKLNDRHIFTLSWSSGGPAAYAISLQKEKSITGSYVAMSVFRPETLGRLENAAGHAYFIDHSPDDRVCDFRMAEQAHKVLRHYGAKTKMVTYEGGHGWRGNVYGRIRDGIRWLELNAGTQVQRQEPAKIQPEPPQASSSFPFVDGFETGRTAPADWRRGANVQGVRYTWDKKQAFEGKASLCLSKTVKHFLPVAQWSRRLDHNGTSNSLHISAQVKARQAAKGVIDVQFLGADRKQWSHQWAAYIGAKKAGDPPANHDWKQYSETVSIPEGTKSIIIALQIYGPGTIWFDELKADYVNE